MIIYFFIFLVFQFLNFSDAMHKSSFQAMERFKNNYSNKEDILKSLDVGSYDSNGTFYNYGKFLRENNWFYNGMDIHEGSNVDIVVDDMYIGMKLKMSIMR